MDRAPNHWPPRPASSQALPTEVKHPSFAYIVNTEQTDDKQPMRCGSSQGPDYTNADLRDLESNYARQMAKTRAVLEGVGT